MSDFITPEIEHPTGRLDGIIREQAGDLVFHDLDQIRRLSATSRRHGDRVSLRAKGALLTQPPGRATLEKYFPTQDGPLPAPHRQPHTFVPAAPGT